DVLGVQMAARVVGVAKRFPTVPSGRPFVLADEGVISAALDARVPGSGEPRELWLSARRGRANELGAAAVAAARRHGLTVRTRAAVARASPGGPAPPEPPGALAAAALLAAGLPGGAVAMRGGPAPRQGPSAFPDPRPRAL